MEINNTINEHNNCSIMELNYLRETIENMNKFNQIEVLKILNSKNNNLLNENKNGVLINLSELDKEIIDELDDFIKHVLTQEIDLKKDEKKKEALHNTYFNDT
jgi:hypothetical protein